MSALKNTGKIVRAAILLLVLCMISTAMLGGTFAKYSSEYAGQDTALVARWDFKVSDGTILLGDSTQALDLFSHAYNKNINGKVGDDYIIAPGVSDDFTIVMNFLSDVDAEVTVEFKDNDLKDEDGHVFPIEYSVADGVWVKSENLSSAFVDALLKKYSNPNDGVKLKDVEDEDDVFIFERSKSDAPQQIELDVKWRWAFDKKDQVGESHQIDSVDTAFGNISAKSTNRTPYTLNVTVSAKQVEHEENSSSNP